MAKILKICVFILLSAIILGSCSSIKTLSNGNSIDKKLVGVWEGSETDQQVEGMKKEWKMTRNMDGTFTLFFKTLYDGETDEFTETGNWWVIDSTFYEYHNISGETDTYKYEVLNNYEVKFEMISSKEAFDNKNYIFIDRKVAKSKSKIVKDGLSFESAIKANSITEEYDYISKNCINCQKLRQALVFNNDNPYDVITVKNQKGEEVSYYFDISSFYGKW